MHMRGLTAAGTVADSHGVPLTVRCKYTNFPDKTRLIEHIVVFQMFQFVLDAFVDILVKALLVQGLRLEVF